MITQPEMEAAYAKRASGADLTHREQRAAFKRAAQLDPTLPARIREQRRRDDERRGQEIQARPLIALAEAELRERETGPFFMALITTNGQSHSRIAIRIRPALLNQGAKEALDAGLATAEHGDDFGLITVRTERTYREVWAAEQADLARRGPDWVHMYGRPNPPADADAYVTETFCPLGCWRPEAETIEDCLNRCLGGLAGRIVRVGIGR